MWYRYEKNHWKAILKKKRLKLLCVHVCLAACLLSFAVPTSEPLCLPSLPSASAARSPGVRILHCRAALAQRKLFRLWDTLLLLLSLLLFSHRFPVTAHILTTFG